MDYSRAVHVGALRESLFRFFQGYLLAIDLDSVP